MSNWAHQQVIWNEIKVNNPAPYVGLLNAAIANLINTTTVPTPDVVTVLSGSQLFEAIDGAEYAALAANVQDRVKLVLGLGDAIQIGPGSKARAVLLAAFGGAAGPNTRANLAALVARDRPRWQVIGLPEAVLEAHVRAARIKNGQSEVQADGVLT